VATIKKIAAGRNYRKMAMESEREPEGRRDPFGPPGVTYSDLNIPDFVDGKGAKDYFDENDAHVILEKDNTGLFPNLEYHRWKQPVEVITQDGRAIKGRVRFSFPSQGAIIIIPS